MEAVLLGRFTAQGNMHWCWQGYIKRKVVFSQCWIGGDCQN